MLVSPPMPYDPRVDAYIAARAAFAQPLLAWLRERVHAACPAVEESIKWGMPAFGLNGRPLANMAGFKAHVTFGFWDRSTHPTGREGEAMGQFGRIVSLDSLPDAPTMEAMIRASALRIGQGAVRQRRPAAPASDPQLPAALRDALDADGEAAAQFAAMPPGARRDYAEWIGEAKRETTRVKRLAEALSCIREGKRRNWKYER